MTGPSETGQGETGQVEILIKGQEEPVIIRADRMEHDENLDLTLFIGRVSLRRGQEILTADRALWHNRTKVAEAAGSVRLEAPEFWMEAERAAVNLELSLAKIYQGRLFFSRKNYYLTGTVIERLSENKFQASEATATTCDGPTPAWTIQADHLTVTEGGYASATGVLLKGAGSTLPFLATPYFIFPVKTERQSGLLKPYLATSSNNGPTVGLPLFWATGESHDLTYTPVWREKRGLASTLEGRYHLDWGRGLWQVSYLDDQENRQYQLADSKEQEKARKRYWLRGQNQGRAGDWDVNLNLDLASDPLYLKEFTKDPDGFNQSSKAFASTFGHTINEALNPNRTSELYAQKLDGSTQARAGLNYTQNLNQKNNYGTVQRMPALQYDLVSRGLETQAFDRQAPRLSLNTRYDHFYRQTDANNLNTEATETGHRVRLQPVADWTRELGPATFKVLGDLDATSYAAAGRRPPNTYATAEHENRYNRLTGSAEMELATTFSRVFEGGPGQAAATRHQVSPTLAFNYVEAPENQGQLPYWDSLDRRLPRRTIRYGLSNNLVAKTAARPSNPKDGAPQAAPADTYFQFLKFGLWTSYELADNSHLADNNRARQDRYYDTDYYDRGSGPLEASLEAFFNPYVSTRLVSNFNTRTGRATDHDLNLNLADDRGDRLTLTYDFDAPEARFIPSNAPSHNEARTNLSLKLNSEWSTAFYTRYDLKGRQSLESSAKLTYRAQCYGLNLIYSKTYQDQSVGLMFDLLGLGSVDFNGAGTMPN
jgi:LPS-assembly protein